MTEENRKQLAVKLKYKNRKEVKIMLRFSQPLEDLENTHRLLLGKIPAGDTKELFDEYEWVDLDEVLRTGGREMIYARVKGFSMIEASINDGDLLIIEVNDQPRSGEIVVANLNGETTVKRWEDVRDQKRRHLRLVPENGKLQPVDVCKDDDFRVIGIVRHIVSSL